MITLDQLHADQLASIGLCWRPLTELYADDDLQGEVLCYQGYTLEPGALFEVERMINENSSPEGILHYLNRYVAEFQG